MSNTVSNTTEKKLTQAIMNAKGNISVMLLDRANKLASYTQCISGGGMKISIDHLTIPLLNRHGGQLFPTEFPIAMLDKAEMTAEETYELQFGASKYIFHINVGSEPMDDAFVEDMLRGIKAVEEGTLTILDKFKQACPKLDIDEYFLATDLLNGDELDRDEWESYLSSKSDVLQNYENWFLSFGKCDLYMELIDGDIVFEKVVNTEALNDFISVGELRLEDVLRVQGQIVHEIQSYSPTNPALVKMANDLIELERVLLNHIRMLALVNDSTEPYEWALSSGRKAF